MYMIPFEPKTCMDQHLCWHLDSSDHTSSWIMPMILCWNKTGESSRIRRAAGWSWPHQFGDVDPEVLTGGDIIAWYHIIWPCAAAVFTLTKQETQRDELLRKDSTCGWDVSQRSVTSPLINTNTIDTRPLAPVCRRTKRYPLHFVPNLSINWLWLHFWHGSKPFGGSISYLLFAVLQNQTVSFLGTFISNE